MKLNLLISALLVVTSISAHGPNMLQDFDRTSYYAALASKNLGTINAGLELVAKSGISNKEAFEGALLMKKAGLVPGAGNKLSLFKSGRVKLEGVIAKEAKNAEFRFLRLMIQENVPGILGYKKQIDEDNKLIHSGFKSLPPAAQKAVVDYSKTSKVLKPAFS